MRREMEDIRMKKMLFATVLAALVLVPVSVFARNVEPFVSGEWLQKNLGSPNLVVIDTRKVEDYKAGHIPGSVNVFYGVWAITKGEMRNELPELDDLGDIIAGAGIKADSTVVVVGPAAADFSFITRVAWTLLYAGVENVAVLDGAWAKWAADGRPVTTDVPKVSASTFKVKARADYFAAKDYVISKVGKTPIIDARSPDVYFGVNKQAFVAQFGHLSSAVNLPSSWITTADGLVRDKAELEAMAISLIKDKNKEVITYCDSGVLCTGWWYVLHELLGYPNVKSYDGSSQEITKDAGVKYVRYTWQ